MIFYQQTWQISVKMQNFSKNLNGFPFVVCADTGLKLGIISYNYVYFLKTLLCKFAQKVRSKGGQICPPPGRRVCKKLPVDYCCFTLHETQPVIIKECLTLIIMFFFKTRPVVYNSSLSHSVSVFKFQSQSVLVGLYLYVGFSESI